MELNINMYTDKEYLEALLKDEQITNAGTREALKRAIKNINRIKEQNELLEETKRIIDRMDSEIWDDEDISEFSYYTIVGYINKAKREIETLIVGDPVERTDEE